MDTRLLACLCGALTLCAPALAQQGDAPFAYPEEEQPSSPTPSTASSRTRPPAEEPSQDFEPLGRMDDPNVGVAFEAVGGALLLNSTRGELFEPRPAAGARFTWEYGRLFGTEDLREALWMDLQWTFTLQSEGTQLVSGDAWIHYIVLAPAYELTFGPKSDFGVYAQLGGGVAYEQARLRVDQELTEVRGLKPLFQYGVGLRGRPRIQSDGNLRLAFRLELTRFRRGYQNDTLLAGSVGLAF